MAGNRKVEKKGKKVQEVSMCPVDFEISEFDQYLFGMGTHYEIYKKLGAHMAEKDGKSGVYFAVWAPHAKSVSVMGDFNGWDKNACEMTRLEPMGIYELFVPGAIRGSLYKYCIRTWDGRELEKADPFAAGAEMRPGNASRVTTIDGYQWSDGNYMDARSGKNPEEEPMFIYEVHPGSWKKHPSAPNNPEGFYNYRQFAHSLTDYVKEMGYTHVELMGIAEHPFDGSWGYQVTGYFAPTSRYGDACDFMYLVDYLHKNGIGVILDWVPAHFPKDAHGLAEFDGTCLFEYADPRKGEHPDWGTKIFDYGKNEVKNFLISNALYWLKEFHVDGLRVDAVASMLYLDYGKQDGQWVANEYGGHENLEAVEFMKHLNSIVKNEVPGALVIAEESTAWPQVTGTVEENGLGFDYKWNMGWMNDFLYYMKLDPIYRQYHHNCMNFGMFYAYTEKFILVLSHDEVVHGKCSLLNKMPGEEADKFRGLKAAYGFMVGHSGKKLLFMGQDFAQKNEWNEAKQLDWELLEEKEHADMHRFVKELIAIYRKHPCLFELDHDEAGFEWMNADDNERSIFSFARHSKNGKDNLLFVCNFTPVAREDYRVGVTRRKQHKLILDSEDVAFGGERVLMGNAFKPEKIEADGKTYSIAFDLPAYGVAVFQF